MKLLDSSLYCCYLSSHLLIIDASTAKDTVSLRNYRGCREEFAGYFTDATKFIGYCNSSGLDVTLFSKFWNEIEEKAGLKNSKTIVHSVEQKNIVILELDPFWTINSTRRGFCTLFLRCGAVYYRGDMAAAFVNYFLLNSIRAAVDHFLTGHTTPTYTSEDLNSAGGVVAYFSSRLSPDRLRTSLVKMIQE